jgi:PIN domain nuclease of toxin-antitoxin system
VKYLLDTHLLIWAVTADKKLSASAAALIDDMENTLVFSVLSLWEIALKRGLNRKDFLYEARFVRQFLLNHGYEELPTSTSLPSTPCRPSTKTLSTAS